MKRHFTLPIGILNLQNGILTEVKLFYFHSARSIAVPFRFISPWADDGTSSTTNEHPLLRPPSTIRLLYLVTKSFNR
jgi:hypothetical protein